MEPNASAAWLVHLPVLTLADVRIAALVMLLAVAATIDARTLRIPNWLTAGGAAIGVVLAAAVPWQWLGPVWALQGLLWSLGGLAAALAILLPLYALRVMGAGDVKLVAMVGAFVGLQQIVQVVLCIFVAGGLLAVAFALRHRMVRQVATNMHELMQSMTAAAFAGVRIAAPVAQHGFAGRLPYGVAICAGTVGWLVLSGGGL